MGSQTLKKLEVSAYIAERQKQIDSERICSIKDIRIISWPKNRLPDDALKIEFILQECYQFNNVEFWWTIGLYSYFSIRKAGEGTKRYSLFR